MARLPKGWTRLKIIGDVEPVQVLVHRESGKFGTLLGDDGTIREWDSLQAAEDWIKDINAANAVDAVMTDGSFSDEVPRLIAVRVKKTGRFWTRMDGTMVPSYQTLLLPDPEVAAALEQKRAEEQQARNELKRVRESAWELVRSMKRLED